jgi:hypothetical protein
MRRLHAGRERDSREKSSLTADLLGRLRDNKFRRSPARRVHGERGALAFVRDVGFCPTFYRFPEGVACLWEAVAGRVTHTMTPASASRGA